MEETTNPPKATLCAECKRARDDPHFSEPTHLVNPVTWASMVYDILGEAICPKCGARWRRTWAKPKLIE
jgi:ribosomal protein L40E